jgi:hypothetical protein
MGRKNVTDYSAIIAQINSSSSLDEISEAVSSYSASAVGSGGILYSGYIGSSRAGDIALNIVNANAANGVTVNIINNTPRGLLLANPAVKAAILSTAQNIYAGEA